MTYPPRPCAHVLPEGRPCNAEPWGHLHQPDCRNGKIDRHHKYVEPRTPVWFGDVKYVAEVSHG